ncbi:MAG: methionine synthase [Candidatus Scalindua sp. AMX11]|nr:MAG: methionine synthase [Candidatus Scalindua sp.]NOG86075.1 methionine synthase [Planctomycetota bacterium]RZV98843.1 MAG: methionine synthase [Candidatus Scalindua sp. SCAELEC01]TDE66967.1 MAG: methionine synthase [Candidatus Scalindua sp. AMX11]GJQ57775.1 MAG: hypothetical protein SCALA701_05760 [Candidatus Scalindua sp.]
MFKGNFSATAIGSFPHKDVGDACDLVLKTLTEVPCWPQLPERDMREEMCVQYTEGLPFLKLIPEKNKIFIDMTDDNTGELEEFYTKYLSEDASQFPISEECSVGFPNLVARLQKKWPDTIRAIKGQIVGPITLAGTLKGSDEIPILHDSVLYDTVVKLLAMKACWQIEQYSAFDVPKIIFLDEPYLSSVGSAFASLKKEQIVDSLNEIFEAIHQRGALAGIHCCGNTDWPMIMDTQVDILNFDAFGYMDSILIYKQEIDAFLKRGGYLAWGIVPTTDSINEVTVEGLLDTLESAVDQLVNKGIEKKLIIDNSLITPSCGTGSLSIDEADKAMNMTHDLSMIIKERFEIS